VLLPHHTCSHLPTQSAADEVQNGCTSGSRQTAAAPQPYCGLQQRESGRAVVEDGAHEAIDATDATQSAATSLIVGRRSNRARLNHPFLFCTPSRSPIVPAFWQPHCNALQLTQDSE